MGFGEAYFYHLEGKMVCVYLQWELQPVGPCVFLGERMGEKKRARAFNFKNVHMCVRAPPCL